MLSLYSALITYYHYRRNEVKMYEYEDVFDAYDREMFERESDEDEGKREQQPDGSFIWVD